MNGYRLSLSARRDLNAILDYVALENIDAAYRILDSLSERFSLIARQPMMGRDSGHLRPGLRCHPVRQYMIFYFSEGHHVEIFRVIHSARDVESLFT